MTEQTGWYEPPAEPAAPEVPGSAAEDVTPPPAPDPSQVPPAGTPAPESDTAPEPPAAEPAPEPAPEQPAAAAPPDLYVPDGQPEWLTDALQKVYDWSVQVHDRLRKLGG